MIADLHIKKTIILIVVSIAAIALGSAFAYSSARAKAYAKLDPYAINFVFEASQESDVILAYDYGYGFTEQHQRTIKQDDEKIEQSHRLSLSSWKTLRSIAFISNTRNKLKFSSLSISKADNTYVPERSSLASVIEGDKRIYRVDLASWAH